jgi:ABC-type dipeptide/oligopeptide/nickel transport system permease component
LDRLSELGGYKDKNIESRKSITKIQSHFAKANALYYSKKYKRSILTETIFSWPGVGRYVLTAISKRDLPAIQGSILFLSLVFVIVNLLTDLLYAKADPRVAYD